MQETWVQSPGQEDFLEKEMAILFIEWKIARIEEPGRLQFINNSKVRTYCIAQGTLNTLQQPI